MLSWQEIVRDYITRYSDKIRKATQPLRDHFGIKYFSYHRIDLDGKYTVLVDRPDWAEVYVDKKIFLHDPYLRHPEVYRSGMTLIHSHGTEEYIDTVLQEGKKVLQADMGLQVIQKREDAVEFFCFGGNKGKDGLENLYMNNPELISTFTRHFKRELNAILRKMRENPGDLSDLKGSDFFNDEIICPNIDRVSRLAFLKKLGLTSEVEMAKKLSLRERECLTKLINGMTAKQTAIELELSPRTIEAYFENIKAKLSCETKQEILHLAKDFQTLGLL